MEHCVRPDANSNSKPDFGSVNFTCLRVRQFYSHHTTVKREMLVKMS